MSQKKSESKTIINPHVTSNGSGLTGAGATITHSTSSSSVSVTTHVSSGPTFFAVGASKDVHSSARSKVTVAGSVNNAGNYEVSGVVGVKW